MSKENNTICRNQEEEFIEQSIIIYIFLYSVIIIFLKVQIIGIYNDFMN